MLTKRGGRCTREGSSEEEEEEDWNTIQELDELEN